jgi:hypothetical protein
MPSPRTPGRTSDVAPPIKPGPDVYIGLLAISLVAQLIAVLFLYMDYSSYPDSNPKAVALPAIGSGPGAAAPTAPTGLPVPGAPAAPGAAPGGPVAAPSGNAPATPPKPGTPATPPTAAPK